MHKKLESLLELGGMKKDVAISVHFGRGTGCELVSIWRSCPLIAAWVAIVLCGVPIILEAFIGLVTRL